MAKGTNDVILRDRLQFDVTAGGDTGLVYGRIDLSDYVSIIENKGLAIKEIRFQLRTTAGAPQSVGMWPNTLAIDDLLNAGNQVWASLKLFATTTAYELVEDVGIASPNVLCVYEQQTQVMTNGIGGPNAVATLDNYNHMYGTPDLHPDGYDVVTDLLIGIALENCSNDAIAGTTCELDVMLIAEPKKITQKDLTQMLTQAQDL